MPFFYTKATKEQANQESIEALATKPLYDDATGNNFLQGEKKWKATKNVFVQKHVQNQLLDISQMPQLSICHQNKHK